MVGQFLVNAVGPALVLKHAIRLLPRDRPSAIVALSARVGSIGDNKIGGWHSYRMAKAAVNQLIHGAAIELARTHKRASCVCM
jgi:NAD(P)-dependent dehydrogenase (short-subunit alcohol dehydrogenase family)